MGLTNKKKTQSLKMEPDLNNKIKDLEFELKTVKEEYEVKLKEKDKSLDSLKKKLRNIPVLPDIQLPLNLLDVERDEYGLITVTNTDIPRNTANLLLPITKDFLTQKVKWLSSKHVEDGSSGLSDYIIKNILINNIRCFSECRHSKSTKGDIVHYNGEGNFSTKDRNAMRLIWAIIKSIHEAWNKISDTLISDLEKKVEESLSRTGQSHYTKTYWSQIFTLQGNKEEIRKILDGNFSTKFAEDIKTRIINYAIIITSSKKYDPLHD
jgi:hypothetical protein